MPVACAVPNRAEGAPSLSGRLTVRLVPGSRIAGIMRRTEIEEQFFCSYELNPEFQTAIDAAGLRVTGVAENGAARVVELPDHRFFLATAFLPQLASTTAQPHPLIIAFLNAAAEFRAERRPSAAAGVPTTSRSPQRGRG